MNINEDLKMIGKLSITKTNEHGQITEQIFVPNLVVTDGKSVIAARMNSAPGVGFGNMTHMSLGTDNTAPALSQRTLVAEVSGSRVTLTSTSVANNVITYTASFPAGVGTGAITEAGIFNGTGLPTDATPTYMLCRTTFPVVNKGALDSIAISWTVTVN